MEEIAGEAAVEVVRSAEHLRMRIEDVEDMIETYKKQPKMPELDLVIEKLEHELEGLKEQEAALTEKK